MSYIKPANYEISKTRKYKNNVSRIENMDYTEFDYYYYTCEDCGNCIHKNKCIKRHNCKTPLEERIKNLKTLKLFNILLKENLERIVNEEDCELRMNGSIKAEECFPEIRQDVDFRIYLSKGKKNVLEKTSF